jgi:myo-inositol 2-dehydrogenase/D-chiro-inositol 1-dehydrogenase
VRRIAEGVPGATVVAVTDSELARGVGVAKQYRARFEPDAKGLIDAADVEAVIIASWDPSHEEYCLAAITAGKYVFCEKPLATSAEGCRRILEAELAGRKHLLQVGFMRRYDEGYRQLKRVVEGGSIGAPLLVHCQHRNKQPVGAKHTTETLVTRALVHEFDVTRWLLGEEYVSAQWVGGKSTRHADPDLLDPQMVLLETTSGVRIDCEIFMSCQYGYDVQCEIVGEEGTVRLPEPASISIRHHGTRSSEMYASWRERFAAAYEVEIREWVESVRAGRVKGPTAWDGYVTCVVADAYTASRRDRAVAPITVGDPPAMYR